MFGAAALTSLGLAVIAWRGMKAREVLDRALREALGDRYAEPGSRHAERRRRIWPSVRTVVAPFLLRRSDVERVANISYGDAGRRNLLDVYLHRSRPTESPVLVYVHGGGYFSGRKSREARALLYRLASLGWVCISANYRLRPAATFPDHLVDLKKVIAWVRSDGEEYGAEPSLVIVAGSSAGGHLAALAALTQGDPMAPVVYAELPGAQHAFDLFHSVRFDAVVDAIVTFAEWVAQCGGSRRSGRGG